MKRNIAVGLLGMALAATSQAGSISYTQVPPGDEGLIEDGTGVSTALYIPGDVTRVVTDVNVRLNIGSQGTAPMWNGDIVAILTHGSTAVTLLDRVGQDDGNNPLGFGDNGFQITLDDLAADDIHNATAGGSTVSGTFNADLGSLLSAFNGLLVDGDWILQVADKNSTGTAQVYSWGLDITFEDVTTVPDSSLGGIGFSAILFGGLLALARRRSWVHGN